MEFIAFTLQPDRQAAYSRQIPYGPANQQALKLLDAERLAVLPSSRDNFPGGTFENFDWWAENDQNVVARFNEWILG
jgi:putative spermidine/putrescine transport system substrate-binding protein